MLRTKVKAGGVSHLTDARYFAARGIEWLGFPMDGELSAAAVHAIRAWVDGVKIVGEFEFSSAEDIRQAHEVHRFDAVQVGMAMPVTEVTKLTGLQVIREVVVEKSTMAEEMATQLHQYGFCCDTFLLDFAKNGLSWADVADGKPVRVSDLRAFCEKYQILIAMWLQPEELPQVLDTLQPLGLALSGSSEEKTGFKSFDELDEIFDVLEKTE